MRKKLLILLPASLAMTLFAKYVPGFAEFYALKIYPVFAGAISFFTSKVKFSLTEFIILVSIAGLTVYFFFAAIKSILEKDMNYIRSFTLNILAVISVIYFLFVLFCGINYHRNEFTYYSTLEIKESSTNELINLCEILISDANEMRANLSTGSEGVSELFDEDYYEIAVKAKNSFAEIAEKYSVLKGRYPAPKPVLFSDIMSHMGITGMFFPYTFEANVNVSIPSYQLPAVMLHELVHLRGFMREDEANFISYLACINSGFDDFYYSGTMLALSYSMNALYREDYGEFARLYAMYSEDVKNDLKYSSDYWKRFEGKAAEISNKVNDTYLKANNQQDGVKSYGRMVDLLIAYYN
ncbi:DUF3810 domain-containing protein [Sedimentibacter hydroxybenzoicus DSM 7310]|uniref:DUF3810 domain-containing protein n=1 Tax=Sedimentibacter hydroxybenzoicus DSM 7310 TaxID=1123245 RepID=A0A974GWL6_SEDHY|nr:DUF3810 domain-containing protein [Sedimentibacter hydroxybenzoicus]NYB74619.1 DUF3810 domain-containing protein [Sedimentibacter hydroxybenzoicus DSM 7310]